MFGHGTIGTITMAIENGLIVPRVQGKLSIPVFDDFHQVAPLARRKAIRPKGHQGSAGQISKQPRIVAIRRPAGDCAAICREGPWPSSSSLNSRAARLQTTGALSRHACWPRTQANHVLPTPPDQSQDLGR